MIHCAAFSAPRANPSRLRAVCRRVMVSAAESNPISCVPGCAPARLELTSMLRVVARGLHLVHQLEQRAGRRVFLGDVMNLPGPGAVLRLVREQPRGFANQAREDVHADGKIRAPDQRAVVFASIDGFSVGQMFEPAGGADHDRDAERGELLDIAEHGGRHGELDRHVRAFRKRFVAIYVDSRADFEIRTPARAARSARPILP